MSKLNCPYCSQSKHHFEIRTKIVRAGFFYRRSDRKRVRKFYCRGCRKNFSNSTSSRNMWQKKRTVNSAVRSLFCSGVSGRRIAKLLSINRKTVARKLEYLGAIAEAELAKNNEKVALAQTIEFDDMETFEHTKCKPLSITLATETGTRRILDLEVSQMPASGKLAKIARKKYGLRKDMRYQGRNHLFSRLSNLVAPNALIKSDQNPHYPPTVKKHFPCAVHQTFPGQRGSIVGQGELKKVRFDPLFSLNHTCAMFRANVNRLIRRTWCTTKKPERLRLHLFIYAQFHNEFLI